MATALQLSTDGADPIYTIADGGTQPIIEPLGGFPTVDDIFADRFAEEVYDQGKDSHLYKFLQGLCGDSGAGMLKKQSYVSRLKTEAQGLVFQEIDTTYNSIRFPRLSFEFPTDFFDGGILDPANSVLTKEEWDQIELGDESYYHRIQQFLQATRLGGTPAGISLAAQAGCGVLVDVFENYRAVYAALHDEAYTPSGGYSLPFLGLTRATGEFVLQPHAEDQVKYTNTFALVSATTTYPNWAATTAYNVDDVVNPVTPPEAGVTHRFVVTVAGTSGGSQPTWPIDGSTVVDGTVTWMDVGAASIGDATAVSTDPGDLTKLDPERERNMVHTVDNLRPVGSIMTVATVVPHYKPIAQPDGTLIDPITLGNSSNFKLVRFVTGRIDVDWPTPDENVATENNPDRAKGYFIEAGVEKEQKNLPLSTREKPVINHTIENVVGYTDVALTDKTYGTADFQPGQYTDYHTGVFNQYAAGVFPALQKLPPAVEYRPFRAVAVQNTPLIFEGNVKNG